MRSPLWLLPLMACHAPSGGVEWLDGDPARFLPAGWSSSGATPQIEADDDTALPDDTQQPDDTDETDPPHDGPPPRVLILIADDFGVDSLGVYADVDDDGSPDDGRVYAPTPTLDDLCRKGLTFTRVWSAPLCSPTRAGVLTGRHPFRTGVGWAEPPYNGLGSDEQTLPRALDAADIGAATANIGKWHLGSTEEFGGPDAPNLMGWDHYAGFLDGRLPSYINWSRTEDGITANETGYATTVTIDDAIDWLDDRAPDEPWVLWVGFAAPHSPFHLPPAHLHSYSHLDGTPGDIIANVPAYYQAMVEAMDSEIGRLLTWLEDNDQGDVTVIFIGDNGTPPEAVQAPFSRYQAKSTLYEGGVHVPMCVWSPSVVQPGRRIHAPVQTLDIFATTLDLMGVPPEVALPEGIAIDSVSFKSYLSEPDTAPLRTWLYTESFNGPMPENEGQTAWDGRYQLIRFTNSGREELYDLYEDPLETNELLSAGELGEEATLAYDGLVALIEGLLATGEEEEEEEAEAAP
ncbi:MAG: sulfatase-like hydrolase/transferase [Alphaproteobacteria bacterium]|nr:sulfatase-like hydrolase/transferase [Alphaproteobacteria bacterium]